MEIFGISLTGRFDSTGSTGITDISASYALSSSYATNAGGASSFLGLTDSI